MIVAIIAILLKLVGVGFLFVAALGILRLTDPFQRMHASTKAGTLGAGLVVAGATVAIGTTMAIVIGFLTVVFLLLTVPVAGHLLGRAAYVSGASLNVASGRDALEGVLPRRSGDTDEPVKQD
ncbi:monovalent cation/H(+) antiporter subunit G [Aliihoeflea aestuarii]|jgi:monovalent cation/proton antiporter MnhG/PhaG subunit|uniref:monovalent cation/H(+) antiporter subunit G n=1 Tax=Aliihoeflea aestuarii TaxID=453840 RepID=UPI0020934892|nr:monovalent cation/H(+) antiporter subunit G [Aliihoeflea aestuarii]